MSKFCDPYSQISSCSTANLSDLVKKHFCRDLAIIVRTDVWEIDLISQNAPKTRRLALNWELPELQMLEIHLHESYWCWLRIHIGFFLRFLLSAAFFCVLYFFWAWNVMRKFVRENCSVYTEFILSNCISFLTIKRKGRVIALCSFYLISVISQLVVLVRN